MGKIILLTLCTALLLGGCASEPGENAENSIESTETESPVSTEWQGAYRKQLLEFMESEDYFEHSAFSIYDISGDGIPELIISPDTSHGASCDIFTYDSGIISLGRLGDYGSIGYYSDKNIIVSGGMGQGIEHTKFFTIENNALNCQAYFYNNRGYAGDENAAYKLDDIEISKDDYDTEIEKYQGGKYISLGTDYTFDEIDKAFEEYDKEIIIEENEWYKFYRYNNLYYCDFYDDNGNAVKSFEALSRLPKINMINDNIIKFSVQAGTGLSTKWSVYFDTEKADFSETFYSVFDESDSKLVYRDGNKIVVRNIFDKSLFYKEISEFSHPLSKALEPFLSVKFVDDGTAVEVEYLSGDNYAKIQERFEL